MNPNTARAEMLKSEVVLPSEPANGLAPMGDALALGRWTAGLRSPLIIQMPAAHLAPWQAAC